MPLAHLPHSYRDDPAVPEFDDAQPIAFMDGECVLCMTGARLLDRLDRGGTIRICTTQSPLGRAVLAHYGQSPDDPDTWLFLQDGVAYGSLEAMIRIGSVVGGIGHLMQVFRILPKGAQDWLYRRIARNRYWVFGRRETCEMPTPGLRARVIG